MITTSKNRKIKIGINKERLSILDKTRVEKRMLLKNAVNKITFKTMAPRYKKPNWSRYFSDFCEIISNEAQIIKVAKH